MLISVHWPTGFPFSDSLIIICGSYYSSKNRNALLALLLHCKIWIWSLTLPLYRKKVKPRTLLDTFCNKKGYPFCSSIKKWCLFHLSKLHVSDKKGLSTVSDRVQRNMCPIAGGWRILLSGWWILFLTCPMGKWSILGHSIHRRTVINLGHQKNFLG